MRLTLALIFGLLLSQLGLSGVAAPSNELPECHMKCCEPQVTVSCCDEQKVPEPVPVEANCACAAHSRQPAPTAPAPQPRESRVDLQVPVATVVAVLPRPQATHFTTSSRRQFHAAPASHNTIQALKGVWRT